MHTVNDDADMLAQFDPVRRDRHDTPIIVQPWPADDIGAEGAAAGDLLFSAHVAACVEDEAREVQFRRDRDRHAQWALVATCLLAGAFVLMLLNGAIP